MKKGIVLVLFLNYVAFGQNDQKNEVYASIGIGQLPFGENHSARSNVFFPSTENSLGSPSTYSSYAIYTLGSTGKISYSANAGVQYVYGSVDNWKDPDGETEDNLRSHNRYHNYFVPEIGVSIEYLAYYQDRFDMPIFVELSYCQIIMSKTNVLLENSDEDHYKLKVDGAGLHLDLGVAWKIKLSEHFRACPKVAYTLISTAAVSGNAGGASADIPFPYGLRFGLNVEYRLK
ncbi:MAG: hypothetical protein L6Q29_05130 [Candidatus Pacebacteria bacterium]|nr:hypothetical protein [Candidatus Paceibacterota bacterium]